MTVEKKEFIWFNTAFGFYDSVNTMLNKNWPFKTDGVIFTPNVPYSRVSFYNIQKTRDVSKRSLVIIP